MDDAKSCLSDAAKSVIDRMLIRLQDTLTEVQIAAIEQLAADGQISDVEAIMNLAELTIEMSEASHGN